MSEHRSIERYLAALFGYAPPRSLIEIRWRTQSGMSRLFFDVSERDGAASDIVRRSACTDVYVGVIPRHRRGGGRNHLVSEARVVWADCDTPASVTALHRFPIRPSIVMASGTADHRHAYWLLADPVGLDEVEQLNRRIAHALGADAASTDCARILRPPSLNHKHIPPTSVTIDRCDARRRHDFGDILRATPAGSETCEHGARSRMNDPLLTVSPRIYVEQLIGIPVPRHGKVPCPFHDDRTPSLHVYDAPERGWYCYGCRRGGSVYDFAALLWGYRGIRGREFVELRDYLRCRLL
jgi:hypothetical protein